ncbi:unnamed protein product [Arabis nemorensis]|uniref:Uncharacterized protein n=1 Tax=Arabis nemorensis TaxID=586526 RepID=A0A565B980_9BRAS|nr:unnamed protein product [Arabis nemorensis]
MMTMNSAAEPEYATAQIAVWWDMKDCPVPECYDAGRKPLITSSSTGVAVAHSILDVNYKRMYSDMLQWGWDNPPPATMMIISDQLEDFFLFNLFLAYSFRPCKMSVLWDSLLAVSETRRHLLQECSERRHVLQKCSARAESESESTGMFYCRLCNLDCDYKSLDRLRTHLSSDEHTQREASIYERIKESKYKRRQWVEAEFSKTKRLRKS